MAKLTANCQHCRKPVEYERYNAGFSDEGHMYCDSDTAVLTWDAYDPHYVGIVGDKHPWTLSSEEQRRVEEALRPCPYGGRFACSNPPRCPHCLGDLRFLVPDGIYFIVTGPRVKAEEVNVWKNVDEQRAF
jgi:hypothetical protein